jgi:hypothetical protein
MITDRKMHEDKARSWIIETPLQYMTKKKKKQQETGNQTTFLPFKSQMNMIHTSKSHEFQQ